ncbi:hypothetical protein BDP27DRAFT_1319788 [Rhodocollybia butyracea]|uniref:Autophagy-related protein 14 n=1 Tax=Rhodocollybia butyracea TaxID=206335 RepID=A0A9P5PUJ7_9AGAR|nr:hypothetical protein BDP27DRAFT_1319788 [Rhodocollybia butyracea]
MPIHVCLLMSLEKPVPFQNALDSNHLFQRRIGHITSIQIRNLTPFPARDTLTSALSKPAHGHLVDDLDATTTRRRARRISTNSIVTLRSLRSDDGEPGDVYEGRKRTSSKVSDKSGTAGRTAPTIRPQRNRTTSLASIFPTTAQDLESSKNYLDHSQAGLEKVVGSRLVQTFLAVTATPEPSELAASSSLSPPGTPSPQKETFSPPNHGRTESWAPTRSAVPTSPLSSSGHVRSLSSASARKVKLANGSTLASSSSTSTSVPSYLSPIHQPSTNPTFSFDPKSEFASWTDFRAVKLKIGLWAKVGSSSSGHINGKGKGKEQSLSGQTPEWQALEEWNVDLNELIPLPKASSDDETSSSHQLPSNTLLVTLNPPGQTFYIHAPSLSHERSPSPTPGYSSDPESIVRKDSEINSSLTVFPSRRKRHRGRQGKESDNGEDVTKTAGWKDLFKLVTIWTTIKDNEKSLEDLVRGLDVLIADDKILPLKREISRRERRISELRSDCAIVSTKSQELRDEILLRRERLRERQTLLARVKQQEQDDLQEQDEIAEDLFDERARVKSLRGVFFPIRTTLISTLSYLFPIELRSPPDLLFTIVDVPLPIPLTPNDPAPPLTLAVHIDVNEETVATALGYVALVVQFLAAYLGYVLVYPITYIGSRSLIRDGISAMVGPRMFPLFSKGVDKYRFEYGVFLLNKDIEMLMVQQDLRAIDIRHTLPNLKNLLLTLTDGEGVPVGLPSGSARASSPNSSLSGLESPRPLSPVETINGGTTPKAKEVDLPQESQTTPPTSGSSTPTALSPAVSKDALKKTSRFLGFTPLAGFLRVRYPSSLLGSTLESSSDEAATSSSQNDYTAADGELGDSLDEDRSQTEAEELGASGQVLDMKVTDRVEDADSPTLRVKGRLNGVWKVQ